MDNHNQLTQLLSEPPPTGWIGSEAGTGTLHGGAAHWAELHTQRRPTREWFESWVERIPNFGCNCSINFQPILLRFLPQIHNLLGPLGATGNPTRKRGFDHADWFPLTVDIHNAVNTELGRPTITLAEAQARWYPHKWRIVTGPRVGFLAIDYSRIGGTETFAQTLLPRLANVIGFASLNPLYGDPRALGVPAYHGPDAIRDLCEESDVIVSWRINPRDYGYTGRVIMIHHGAVIDQGETNACLVGDEIVCVSKSMAQHLRTVTRKPVRHIPNAVDPSRLRPKVAQASTLWSTLGPATKLCIWAHRFAHDKRPELAIAIAEHLPADWHMLMAGKHNDAIKLPPSDRVTILPPQHPGDLLSRAACFLSTSRFDGFGLSVAEAIAAGVPVVSSPAGIATEPGLATIVPHDAPPSEWAAAIVRASSAESRPKLPAEYDLTTHVETWHRLLACVLSS